MPTINHLKILALAAFHVCPLSNVRTLSEEQLPAVHKANQNGFPVGEFNHAIDKRSVDQLSDRAKCKAGRASMVKCQATSMTPFPRFSITS